MLDLLCFQIVVAQMHFGEALQLLSESVRLSTSHYSAYSSGLLRFEVGSLTGQVALHTQKPACLPFWCYSACFNVRVDAERQQKT